MTSATQQKVDIKMSRFDNAPWGFRVHGGIDFGSPLTIQKVNLRSPGEAAGLQAGDVILTVNGQDISLLRHKEAQEAIKRAGNNFVLAVKRGANAAQPPPPPQPNSAPPNNAMVEALNQNKSGQATNAEDFTKQFMSEMFGAGAQPPPKFKPQVAPVGQMPKAPSAPGQTFTKTSLQGPSQKEDFYEHKHNIQAKGFNASQPNKVSNGNASPKPSGKLGPNIPTKQYNSPKNMYSDSAIQEIMEQQAEVLSGGVKGIDFSKDNPSPTPGDISTSETLKMVRDMDEHKDLYSSHDPPGYELESAPSHVTGLSNANVQSASFKLLQRALDMDEDLSQFHGSARAPRVNQDHVTSAFRSNPSPIRPIQSPSQQMLAGQSQQSNQQPINRAPAPQSTFQERPAAPVANNHQQQNSTPPIKQVPIQQNWNETLNKDRAGQANNAEDFTKQFMSQMYGGGNQPSQQPILNNNRMPVQNSAPAPKPTLQQNSAPPKQVPIQQNWNSTLNNDKAGQATNAEDFTKQFMSQMYGGQQPQQQQMMQQQEMSRTTQHSTFQQKPSQGPTSSNNAGTPQQGRDVIINTSSGQKKETIVSVETKHRTGNETSLPPICHKCLNSIDRGPFITAMGKTWCPPHFCCSQATCQRSLQEVGFVEEKGHLYCEDCYGKYLAPNCEKCRKKILGNCLKAMGKTFHPECFVCAYCGKIFANSPFYLEDGLPYCEEDWNELFTTKCVSCGFPIEAGDRWVEALNNNYHSQCFNCTLCKKNLEGKGFFVKAGKPFCKSHARMGI